MLLRCYLKKNSIFIIFVDKRHKISSWESITFKIEKLARYAFQYLKTTSLFFISYFIFAHKYMDNLSVVCCFLSYMLLIIASDLTKRTETKIEKILLFQLSISCSCHSVGLLMINYLWLFPQNQTTKLYF